MHRDNFLKLITTLLSPCHRMTSCHPIALIGLVFILSACAAKAAPQLIASYPANGKPPEQYVYNAYLELEVADPQAAAKRAEDRAYELGGYLVSSQTWYRDGSRYITLALAVPPQNFASLRSTLRRLGKLQGEQVGGEWTGGSDVYSQVTVQLRPRLTLVNPFPQVGWNPGRTFVQALGVSAAIFGFVVDTFIWVLVIAGPFVLIFWGSRRLLKWGRNR